MSRTVRSLRLGKALRRLREAAGLSHQEALDRLVWSRAKVDRIESGDTIPKPPDLAAALDLYGADEVTRAALTQWRTDAKRRDWYASYADVWRGDYVGLEWEAEHVFEWQGDVIPGLLQTSDYARAVISSANPKAATEWVDRAVLARMSRKELLTRGSAPASLYCVVDEGVLRRQVGDPQIMRSQVSYLWEMSRRDNITVQVLPFASPAARPGSFIKLTFPPDVDMPPVVFVEGLWGAAALENPVDVARFTLAEEGVVNTSLDPEESAAFVAALVNEE